MLNKSFPVLPMPEIIESNLNHSFKVSNFELSRNNFVVYIFFFHFSPKNVFFSSTHEMNIDETKSRQSCIQRNSVSPAIITMKSTASHSEIKIIPRRPHQRRSPATRLLICWPAASTIGRRTSRTSSSASRRSGSWAREASGKCFTCAAGTTESFMQ